MVTDAWDLDPSIAAVLAGLLNLDEFEPLARARMTPSAFGYVAGGADDEATLRRNRAAFGRFLLRPRVLGGFDRPELSTTVLGQQIALPVLLAPTAFHRLACDDGELAAARAAHAAHTILIASTLATRSLESIAAAAGGPLWFQLYWYRDRRLTEALVRRARAAGYTALCLTVDTPVLGRRERDLRQGFALPEGLEMANFTGSHRAEMPEVPAGYSLTAYIADQLDPSLSWQDLDWLRSLTDLPLVVKGVMTGEDAALSVEHGAAGIVVSNHGGRQLDSAPAPIEMLGEVVAAVQGRCEVYLDGGIRRGTDVVKALALGARAVLIGRPYVWGLAVAAELGATRVLSLLAAELRTALHLCGVRTVTGIDAGVLMAAPPL